MHCFHTRIAINILRYFLPTEGRKMTDINRRLQYNSTNQKQAKQAAEFLELDRQGKDIEEKGQVRSLEGISTLTTFFH